MTDLEINIAVAECLGWTKLKMQQLDRQHPNDRSDWPHGMSPESIDRWSEVPDYAKDLNAMRAAVERFPGWIGFSDHGTKEGFARYLREICGAGAEYEIGDGALFRLVNATARQRAEAFLKTLGKWKG